MKAFKVWAISQTSNSFGLRSLLATAQDGETWKLLANTLHCPTAGALLHCAPAFGWSLLGFECPEQLDTMTGSALDEVWPATDPTLEADACVIVEAS